METFTIEPSRIPGRLAVFFEAIPESWRELRGLKKEISGQQTRITGTTKNLWWDTDQKLLFDQTEITLLLSNDTLEIQIEEIRATQKLFPDLQLNWSAKDLDSGLVLFTADELAGYPLKKEQLGDLVFLSDIDTLSRLGNFDRFTYEIHLTGFVELVVNHIWRASVEPKLQFGDLFSVDELNLTGTVGYNPVIENKTFIRWQNITLGATTHIGKLEVDFSLNWSEGADYVLRISPKAENGFSDFSNLLSAFDQGGMESTLEAFAKELPILDDIQISQVSAEFQKETLVLNRLVFFGRLFCFDAEFEIRFTIVRSELFLLSIRLVTGSFFTVNDLLGSFPGGKLKLPLNARVDNLVLNAQLNSPGFGFSINIIENWQFSIGAAPIIINDLNLFVAKEFGDYRFRLIGNFEIGGVDLRLIARNDDRAPSSGWLFETDVAQRTAIKLEDIITDLGQLFHFSVPEHIPPFTAHNIMASFDTGSHDFSLQLAVSLEKPGIGPFNEGDVFVTIDLLKNGKGGHDFQMSLSGRVFVAGTELTVDATDIGRKDWALNLTWDKEETEGIDLLKWMQFFAGDSFEPHSDFHKIKDHLAIQHLEFHYQHGVPESEGQEAMDTSFLMDLKVGNQDNTYEGVFSGIKSGNEDAAWNFLIGIGYDHHQTIPKELFPNEHLSKFSLESLWILVNTAKESGAIWPPLPESIPSLIKERAPVAGIAVTAEMDLLQQNMIPGAEKVFGLENSKVVILAEATKEGLLLEASIQEHVTIPTGQGKELIIEEASISLTIGEVISFKLSGVFEMELDDHNQRLTISLDIDQFGMIIVTDAKIDTRGWVPFGLHGINIDELGFELGVDFVPPGARVGFQGEMHLDGEKKGSNDLAIVMEFVGPIPNPEYLAIAFSQIKFSDILALFPGSSEAGHQHISDNLFEIDDFGLVWCEKPVVLPDGTNGRLGISLHGAVKILDWGAFFSLEVHPESGIQGIGELSPIKLGPLSITGKGNGVSILKQKIGSEWQNISNVRVNPNGRTLPPDKKIEPLIRPFQIVKPGGVEIQFNSTASPYLRMSANVNLFGMDLLDIDIDIENDQAKFDLFFQIPPIAKFRVNSFLDKNHDFGFNGTFFLGIDLKIDIPFFFGPIHIDIRLGIEASLQFEKKNDHFSFALKGDVVVMKHHYSLVNVEFKNVPASLKDLPERIMTEIKTWHAPNLTKNIQDGSGANNDDAYSQNRKQAAIELLEHAKNWADFVHRDILALQEEKDLTQEAIKSLTEKIKADTQAITKAGEAHVKAIHENGLAEKTHLDFLITAVSAKVADANDWRAQEMKRMIREIEWLKDETGILRKKLEEIWDENDGNEQVINEFTKQHLAFDAVRNPDGYPQCAIDHHLRLIRINNLAHQQEHEILKTGRNHAKGILSHMANQRFDPLKNHENYE